VAARRSDRPTIDAAHTAAIADALEEKLFHHFADRGQLVRAFIHPSAVKGDVQSNQRLEFLGDRVLGLAVAEMLHGEFPKESEGALARRFTALVRREALERIARHLGLGELLILGKGEEEGGGRDNAANLADACEALIAALFVDGGYPPAARFVRHYWAAMMAESKAPPRDAKTALQEWAQAKHGALPSYRLIAQHGPAHAPNFEIEACVGDLPGAVASGGNKQAAEQAAAKLLLKRLAAGDG
jgi:ribonuclease-3